MTAPETATADGAPPLTALAARIDELSAGLARLSADVEDLAAALLPYPELGTSDGALGSADGQLARPAELATEPTASSQAAATPAGVEPCYATVHEWVEQYFLPTFTRPIGGEYRWCSRWDQHPEAITRLEALWRSWETLRLDPNTGIATWLVSYLDPQLAVLLSRTGPFARCTPQRHVGVGGG